MFKTKATRFKQSTSALVFLSMLLSACADTGLTRPLLPLEDANEDHALAVGSRVSGVADITVSALDGTGGFQKRIASDRATFVADVRSGAPVIASLSAAGGGSSTMYGMPDGMSLRQGAWSEDIPATATSPSRRFTHFADRGEPVSRTEYWKNGVLQFIRSTAWAKVSGGWAVRRHETVLFKDGQSFRSITQSFSQSDAEPGAAISMPTQLNPKGAIGTFGQPNDANCTPQMDAMDLALAYYMAADVALSGCLLGVIACLGVSANFAYANYALETAIYRANQCLNAQ